MEECALCDIDSDTNPTFIKEYEYWTVLTSYSPTTLGSSLIVLNRHAQQLSELTEKEITDYLTIVKDLEHALKESFNPDMINYLMLANVVRHVHYHVVPRYEKDIEFAGIIWKDERYGHSPILSHERKDDNTLQQIIEKLSENL